MFSRVTLCEIDTLRTDVAAAVELFRAEVLPELREQPGYAGVLVLTTPEGRGMIMSLWATEEHAASGAFYPAALERHMALFRSPPGRERYEVALIEVPALAPE